MQVLQFPFLLPEFSARENVMLPVQRLGRLSRAAAEVRVTELLDNFGLAAEAERQLSGGQNQRVATRAGAHTLSRFVDWRTCQYH